ncbi:MAG: efflux RND transporter periplasmic adaptor subunit [Deltaproteobacteria bacterium]|nr:efflux RND transporter periplasmic adaptor subunit [Deltaproteobacteria bacterium]
MALTATLAVSGGCAPSTSALGSTGSQPALVVTRDTLEERILLTGELEASQADALLVPQTESWAISIRWMADDGTDVRKGDKIVELDNTAILEQISDHDLAVIQASIELSAQQATAAVEESDKRFEVQTQRTNLAKAKLDAQVPPELVSVRDLQQFQLAVQTAKTALATAEDDLIASKKGGALEEEVKRIALEKARRKLVAATGQIDALELTAPRDGVVIIGDHPWEGRKLQVGDTVWPGTKVAKLPNLAEMIVQAEVSDVDDGRITAGMRARCVVDAFPDRPIEAVVLSVSPVAREPEHQSARRFFSVVLQLEETDPEIMRPGLSVKAEVITARHEDVVMVPRLALDTSHDPAQVELASGKVLEVELGACNAQDCEVLAGVEPGAELLPAGGSQ